MTYSYDRRAGEDSPRTADQGAVYDSDLAEMAPEESAKWKGYTARLIHSIYSQEEFEDIGDTSNRKTEHAGPFMTLESLVKHMGSYKWSEWIDRDQGLIGGKPKTDRKGGAAQTDAYVERKDGKTLNHEEREFLTDRLRIK